jgi:hypothetical protein
MVVKKCKECGKEISKSVKECIHCGADQKNRFIKNYAILRDWAVKHPVLTTVFVFMFIFGTILDRSNNKTSKPETVVQVQPESKKVSQPVEKPKIESNSDTNPETLKDWLKESHKERLYTSELYLKKAFNSKLLRNVSYNNTTEFTKLTEQLESCVTETAKGSKEGEDYTVTMGISTCFSVL